MNNNWQEVKKYNNPNENVTLKKIWKGFMISLCALGIAGAVKVGRDVGKMLEEKSVKEEIKEIKTHKPTELEAKSYFFKWKDQEYLNMITDGSHEEWDALPENIKKWIRDPDKYLEAKQKQEEKYASSEENISLETLDVDESNMDIETIEYNEIDEEPIIEILDDGEILLEDSIFIETGNPEFEIVIEDSTVFFPENSYNNVEDIFGIDGYSIEDLEDERE